MRLTLPAGTSWLLLALSVPGLPGACASRPANRPGGAPSARPTTSVASDPAAASGAGLPPPLPPSAPGAPGLDALLDRLRALGSQRFDRGAQDRGCPADQTLGDYVALLVREGAPGAAGTRDSVTRLSASCRDFPAALAPVDPPADRAHWYCQLDAFSSDRGGESPWHYELRLRVRRSDGAIDTAYLSCPGTP